jgi:hypothetical protein
MLKQKTIESYIELIEFKLRDNDFICLSLPLSIINPFDSGHRPLDSQERKELEKLEVIKYNFFAHDNTLHHDKVGEIVRAIKAGKYIRPIACEWGPLEFKLQRKDGFCRYWAHKVLGIEYIDCIIGKKVAAGFQEGENAILSKEEYFKIIDNDKDLSRRIKMWGERTVEVPWMLNRIKGKSCLDIGSAESCYVDELLDKNILKLLLNDVREFSTHKSDSRVECIVSDIRRKDPEELGKFDNVLCISTLEHIGLTAYGQTRETSLKDSAYYPQRKAFGHMMKFLEQDGQAILTVPYGKFEDSGWVIVYDKGMIRELTAPFEVVEEVYFTLVSRENDTWKEVKESQCPLKGMDHYKGNMRANSVCCLILKNKK